MPTHVLRVVATAALAISSWQSDAVVMGRTHRHVVADTKSGLRYVLHVALPPDYERATPAFPVVYLLDSQFDFAAVAGSLPAQYEDRLIPQVIVVGITWDPAPADYSPLRQRDFTPTPIAAFPASRHAAEFYACLTETLIPFIERTYRASRTDRSLVGSSLGGLFTLYALFHDGTPFTRYVLTSPSLNYDNSVILRIEADRAARADRPPRSSVDPGLLTRSLDACAERRCRDRCGRTNTDSPAGRQVEEQFRR
jgi:predicted alpha/beta superfamily hydrolase